jgi:hypothetical protein
MMYSGSSSSLAVSAEAAGVLETAVVRTALGEHQMCAALDDAIQAAGVATLRHQAWLLSLSEDSNGLSYDDKVQSCAPPTHAMWPDMTPSLCLPRRRNHSCGPLRRI